MNRRGGRNAVVNAVADRAPCQWRQFSRVFGRSPETSTRATPLRALSAFCENFKSSSRPSSVRSCMPGRPNTACKCTAGASISPELMSWPPGRAKPFKVIGDARDRLPIAGQDALAGDAPEILHDKVPSVGLLARRDQGSPGDPPLGRSVCCSAPAGNRAAHPSRSEVVSARAPRTERPRGQAVSAAFSRSIAAISYSFAMRSKGSATLLIR